jgi:MFS family permease
VQDRVGIGEGALGLALAMAAAGSLIGMPLAGWLTARHGSRVVTRATLTLFVLSLPLPALATSLGPLMAGTFLFGAFGGALDVAMNAHGVALERRYERPILSSFHAAWSIGGLTGAATGAVAAGAAVDVRAHLIGATVVGLAVGVVLTRRLLPGGEDAAAAGPLLALPSRALLPLGVLAFCCLLVEGAAADWSAVYVDDSLAAGAGVAGLAYAAFSLTMTGGRLVGDRLTLAWGPVALIRRGALLGAAGLGGALAIGHPAAALVGFACLGAGLAAIVPVVFRAAGNAPGVEAGVALAAVSTMGYLGFLAGPPSIGGLAELTSLPVALWVLPLLTLATFLLATTARPARPR